MSLCNSFFGSTRIVFRIFSHILDNIPYNEHGATSPWCFSGWCYTRRCFHCITIMDKPPAASHSPSILAPDNAFIVQHFIPPVVVVNPHFHFHGQQLLQPLGSFVGSDSFLPRPPAQVSIGGRGDVSETNDGREVCANTAGCEQQGAIILMIFLTTQTHLPRT